jgi:hypothetical protein
MEISVEKLHRELSAAGIPICGCATDGRIDFLPEATDAHRKAAAAILAAHVSFDPAEMDAKTDRAIQSALHPCAARGEEAAITREQMQAVLAKLRMEPAEKYARLIEISDKSVAEGKMAKAEATKAG